MTHDDLCMNPDPDIDQCMICELILRVRRDERDVVDGDSELDLEEIKLVAFERGYKEGKSSIVKEPIVQDSTTDLIGIKDYILKNMKDLSLEQTNALYGLYVFLGGK